ncbi:golgin subfamily A member 3-like [Galleria mellonella]|uniref:Golgin subfamily A member 3-like n=1 Tax=Galleria mellonella TaxID=7137 RepID=A0ABM3MNH4_GALME|nr:golgin subfamily A member 3-like [Galleria mellonella]
MPQSDFWPFIRSKAEENVNAESSLLQKQLGDMEGEVKEIQMELAAIKRDRTDLLNKKQVKGLAGFQDITGEIGNINENKLIADNCDDYPSFPDHEVSKLREELVRIKNVADQERFLREKYETRLKDLELKLNTIRCPDIKADTKEVQRFSEGEVTAMKMQIRDLKEEMEEMKITLVEKNEQLQEYRVKYLQAQQQVEELKRQLDVIEFDNKHVSDQIQIEIQKMKMQFQEKLQELAPLPDLLKGAQIQLQEAKQLQRLAEDSSHQLSNELYRVKEKLVIAVNNFNQEKTEKIKLCEENKLFRMSTDEKQKEIDELDKKLDDYKCQVLRLEEKLLQQESRFKEKTTECTQLLRDLDEIRQENNRSLVRNKERADSMRRYLQTQISELERQLIQNRAQSRACQKERDEIRQRMQIQVNNLQENFELVEIRLRALQNQVVSLKNSYTVILSDEDDNELSKISAAT